MSRDGRAPHHAHRAPPAVAGGFPLQLQLCVCVSGAWAGRCNHDCIGLARGPAAVVARSAQLSRGCDSLSAPQPSVRASAWSSRCASRSCRQAPGLENTFQVPPGDFAVLVRRTTTLSSTPRTVGERDRRPRVGSRCTVYMLRTNGALAGPATRAGSAGLHVSLSTRRLA